jgi:ribose transport system ATP-binding protein
LSKEILKLINISKSFDSNKVIDDVSISFSEGLIYSVLGKNGAGKTTLMKTIMGVYQPDNGQIIYEGNQITINSPADANKLGIKMLYQEPQLINELTVADNIFLNSEPTTLFNKIDFKKMCVEADALLKPFKTNIKPKQLVKELSLNQKQIVAFSKAILSKTKILILDEPTATLSKNEIERFLKIVMDLKNKGITVIYISHHLEEVTSISDKIVIMRNSKVVELFDKEEFNNKVLVERMVGIDYINRYPRTKTEIGKKILELKNVSSQTSSVDNVSFDVSEGEIIGIAGLLGSGEIELAEIISGRQSLTKGELFLDGKKITINTPYDAISKGISYVGKEMYSSLISLLDIEQNITLGNWDKISRTPFIHPSTCRRQAKYFAKKFRIQDSISNFPVKNLSAGTKKKVALARSILSDSKVIILDDPTRYLDIPVKVELYNILNVMSHKKIAIVLISSDIEELIGMSDRILVLYKGKIVKELNSKNTSSLEILYYSAGGKSNVSNVYSIDEK